jgi:hypothetical protein
MTTDQLIAMCFPLLALVGPGIVALFLVKPWSKVVPVATSVVPTDDDVGSEHIGAAQRRDSEIRMSLREAEALIRKAERQLSETGTL